MAAIAITIIVALPIGVGYIMAFDETEVTGWRSTETTNLSDLILNSETDYYSVSTAPGNNSELIYNDLLGGESSIVSPDYERVGSTVTSLPTYTQTTSTITKPSANVQTFTGSTSPFIISVADNQVPADVSVYGIVRIATEQRAQYTSDVTLWLFSGNMDFLATDSGLVHSMGFPLNQYVSFGTDRVPNTYTVSSVPWKTIGISGDWSAAMSYGALKLVGDDTTYVTISSTTEIFRLGSVVIVGGDIYTGVTAVQFASFQDLIVSQTVLDSDSYANPSYGWRVPDLTSGAYNADWTNGQQNSDITMYLNVPVDTFATYTIGENVLELTRQTSGSVILEMGDTSVNLGNYQYLQIDFGLSSVTVSGISAWPTMYATVNKINSKTLEYGNPLSDPFSLITIDDGSEILYRVDSATIVAGQYPSTKDYTLNLGEYWPDTSYALDLLNIGVYGSSITFGGNSYVVDNGAIMVGGRSVSLLTATFSGTLSQGVWTYSINNVEQSTSETALPVIFGGEWSLTLMGYKMEEYRQTISEWQPGEFALDPNDFVIVGLFGCLAVFVGLGLWGARSGGKAVWLMIICGSAALILISLI